MSPTDPEFWSGQVEARLGAVEKQVEAIWVKLGHIGENVSETHTDVRELRALLNGLPDRVKSLEESRAKGRGVIVVISAVAALIGALLNGLWARGGQP